MKERKPLFPEYIWMFFVGLLLAIIVCMRLLPGHADYIVADNPYNDNIIFITLEGKKIHFTSFMGNEIYSTINSNNSDWTEALESDIVSYANYAKLYFGEGNFSVVVVDNYSVSYNYNRFIQLIGPIVGTIYSSYYTGPSEDFLVLNNPWASLSENTFSEYYPTLYTLNLGGYLMPYYKLDPDSVPTSTPTLTPTPEVSDPCFTYCVKCDTSYYLVDIYGEVGYELQANADAIFNQIASEYSSTDRTLLRSCFVIKNDRFNGTAANWQYTGPYIIFYGQFNSFSKAVSYNMGSSYISDFDYVRSTFSGIEVPESTSYEAGYLGYKLQTLTEGGYCLGLWTRGAMTYASSPSVVEYCDFEYVTTSFSYNYYPITLDPFMLTINASYPKTMHNYYLSLVARLGLSTDTPVEGDATPTPSPTVTPTQAPYVEVILPSGTPTPTPPVSFAGSDLPGGASGEGGSISGAGGMNASEAESIYQYWTNKITNNQALAFLVSFFGLLPFDLVYALGTIIFILILLAMVRLFIHFIS